MSETDVVGRVKELMPYIIAIVIFVCITVLRYGDMVSEEHFMYALLLVAGYVFGEVTGTIRFNRIKKMLNELEKR